MRNAFTPSSKPLNVAVIGSGISGAAAAWLLSGGHRVTVFEKDRRIGGHTNTVDVKIQGRTVPVDTGFIVYNDRNYPNLAALFRHLDVPVSETDMSFAASLDDGAFEYSGRGLGGLLAQRRNILRPRLWRMTADILRFYRDAARLIDRPGAERLSLGAFLEQGGYGRDFLNDHLLPMGAAIWSTPVKDMLAHPAAGFVRFCDNHGLLRIRDRPQWRTVVGGARNYLERLSAPYAGRIHAGRGVTGLRRTDGGVAVTDVHGRTERFDRAIVACHADQALALLSDADADERALLSAFPYERNLAVLHRDARLMPRRRRVWASWNYLSRKGADGARKLCVTYWMNALQPLPVDADLFVTLNPHRPIAGDKILARIDYDHPRFSVDGYIAQKRLWDLQGRRNTWFCGSYFGAGFHEDGLQSGLAAAEDLGGMRRPWTVKNESGRIFRTPRSTVPDAAE